MVDLKIRNLVENVIINVYWVETKVTLNKF